MFEKRRFLIVIIVTLLLAGFSLTYSPNYGQIAAAQSTGDTLPTRTKTPTSTRTSTSTPKPSATPVPMVWQARLVSNTLGVTEGQGSIFRVSVFGLKDTPIELRSADQLIVANSGTKSEYGPYSAEFAPVTEGTWTVSVPAIGLSIEVFADNYNLAVIEFEQVPKMEATATVRPSITATPLGATPWQGRLIKELPGAGVPFSRLLIQVVGRNGQPVQLATSSQVINMAHTGQKPAELGPNTVEFTGLTPGKYIITPLGLNTSFEVALKPNIETHVEFRTVSPTATVSPTPSATRIPTVRPSPRPTLTPVRPTTTATTTSSPTPTATSTPTAPPTLTATPQSTPTPVTRWLGIIESRTPSTLSSSITIKINGIEGLPLRLTAVNTEIEHRCITGQAGQEQDACSFTNLEQGHYVIAPEGLKAKLPLMLAKNEAVQVNFDIEVLPPGITGWQARLNSNSNGFHAMSRYDSTIRTRLTGREGQIIALRPARSPNSVKYCQVIYNPVLGGLMCEFGQLGPGVYLIEALNTGARLSLFVDGMGEAEIEFSPSATYATLALSQTSAQVGLGARPSQPTTTATPTATATQIMVVTTKQPTPTRTVTPSPTPAFAWQGRVIESNYTGAGAIGVRAAGLNDHPVMLRSGGWQSPLQMTGTKNELGLYATEFGGLAPGEYIVELVDLAELKVNLQAGESMLVEFRYDFVNPP